MQFDKDMNSEVAELFLDVREFIIKEIKKSDTEIIEKQTEHLTSFYAKEFDNGFCYVKTKENYVHIGWFKGAMIEDTHNLLEGNGKIIRGQKIKQLDKTQKKAIKYYIKQMQIILMEHQEKKRLKKFFCCSIIQNKNKGI